MNSILDSCRGAQTLRAFLDAPETAEPENDSQAADTAAHILGGCPSCQQHLAASLARPNVPSRITRALRTLGPEHPQFFHLWFADRPGRAKPPPELSRPESGKASRSKTAYLHAVSAYAQSLIVQSLSPSEHLEKVRDLLTHAMTSNYPGLDAHEWRLLIKHATVAALEAAFRFQDQEAWERYEDLLLVFLEYDHRYSFADTEMSLVILARWREGRFDEISGPLEEMDDSEDISPWATAWRTSLFHLLAGDPLEVVPQLAALDRLKAKPSQAAGRRRSALHVLSRASLVDFSEASSMRRAS